MLYVYVTYKGSDHRDYTCCMYMLYRLAGIYDVYIYHTCCVYMLYGLAGIYVVYICMLYILHVYVI